ncbi:MAG: apolipoprotein N-acyltransferase [Proteobacteria bacterium]|nr:apolipoprotein N-acyltransferase [Pseudomonadota bacterium]
MTAALIRTGDYLKSLSGWRAFAAAVGAGALSALGFAPLGIFPALLLGFATLVLLIDGAVSSPRPIRNAMKAGWGFGFGQFATGMHWIFYPFLVDPLDHAWQIPFVALIFPGGLALFAMAAAAACLLFWKPGASRVLMLTVCYSLAEWLRGHVLSGLPWNLPAYGWGASLAIEQSMAVVGAYGLSFLTVLLGASLAELTTRRWTLPAVAAGLFFLIWIGGAVRLASTPTEYVDGVNVRLVQPNIPQDEKPRRDLAQTNWDRLIELSGRTGAGPAPTVIVWPEAAPPFLLQGNQTALQQIAALNDGRRVLITGNQRVAYAMDGKRRVYNSLYIFGPDGNAIAVYDKFHLVPFGEYLPLESILARLGITKLVGFPGSFSAGDGPHTFAIPGAPDVGPLICYEILFPGSVIGESRPGWLVNVTDDSWFGPWAGPRQHLLAARARAIEEGLPVARAANTGISAMIDSNGRVIASLGLDETGVVDARLPKSLSKTIYARLGDLAFGLMLVLCLGLSWALARRSQAL